MVRKYEPYKLLHANMQHVYKISGNNGRSITMVGAFADLVGRVTRREKYFTSSSAVNQNTSWRLFATVNRECSGSWCNWGCAKKLSTPSDMMKIISSLLKK